VSATKSRSYLMTAAATHGLSLQEEKRSCKRWRSMAMEQMPLTYRWYFDPVGRPINAASIVPCMLRDYGDIDQVLAAIAPRKMLSAAGLGKPARRLPTLRQIKGLFSENSVVLTDWLK
jgi:hypothetical protein